MVLKGFKDFIMRGNVVDLAVGVVIGAAFTGLVTQFTNSFLNPLIKLAGGGTGKKVGATFAVRGVTFAYGDFINAALTFVLTAAVLYFLVVLPMSKLAKRRKRGERPAPADQSEEIKLLTDIRDALVVHGPGAPAQRTGNGAPQPQRGTTS